MTRQTLALLSVFTWLAGCATDDLQRHAQDTQSFARNTFQADAALHADDNARQRSRDAAKAMLARGPLSQDDAVRVALLHAPSFQAMLAESTREAADAARLSRPSNPVFTFERLVRREHGEVDLDIGRLLSVSILEWLTWPQRHEASTAMAERARLNAAGASVDAAREAREAWVRAVAAGQALLYFEQVMDAAEASAELAKRMYQAGNFSRLQRARQHAFYADAAVQLTRARQGVLATREALVRTLGLDSSLAGSLTLPPRLPDPPVEARREASTAQTAMQQRIDVAMAQAGLKAQAARLGFETPSSFVNAFHVAAARNSETGKPPQRGYELEIALPLFDFGNAQRAGARAAYLAALNRAAQTVVDAESRVREHYAAYRAAHDLALHYRLEIVPLRKSIADETLLKYNGMLTGVFDLLAESRTQIASVIQAIETERDFWLADAALSATLLGRPVSGSGLTAASAAASDSGPAH
ncbi:MAG: TolC family protein [Betaproteobacteria bacterium]|nr:TolC family protein [Betaproteobacteria bacterium]